MRLVIDSNRVIAALLKDSTSREILLHEEFNFYAPDYLQAEIQRYKAYLSEKVKQPESQIDAMLHLLIAEITLVPYGEFKGEMQRAIAIMGDIDEKDVPFMAVGLGIAADGIWTEDKHFKKQTKLKVYSTKDLIAFL